MASFFICLLLCFSHLFFISSSFSHHSIPLFPSSTGSYSISLSLGTPPQKIPAFVDTGSSLVWVPCTSNYSCSDCTNTNITTFKPKLSSSKQHITCHNEKCKWLDLPNSIASCFNCEGSCSKPCLYSQNYGAGDTSGQAASDNLNLPNNKVFSDFFFGCSKVSDEMPAGIIGFGRSPSSLPSQLKLDKFSYCLILHKFAGTSKSGSLILGNTAAVPGTQYTPLLKNPKMFPYNQYYYVHMDKITVGTKPVRIPQGILVPDSSGKGGSIMDSGSSLTSMVSSLFDPMMNEFLAQMTPAQKNRIVPLPGSNLLCVNVSGSEPRDPLPNIVFHFKGGATMDVPVANYLNLGDGIRCLPLIYTTSIVTGANGTGLAMIIGNFMQQNYLLEYDLRNERLGLKKQKCG